MINPNSNNWLGASDPIVQYSWDHIKHHCKVSLQRPTSTGLISKRCTREVSNEEERSLSHSGANFIEVPLVSLSLAPRQQAARCFPDSELGQGISFWEGLPPLVNPSLGMAIPVYTAQVCKAVLIISSAFKLND